MAKYLYPAVFELEDKGVYSVSFPDIEGCYTCGENLTEAFEMAQDALALMMSHYETEGKSIPAPSALSDIRSPHLVNYIFAAT